MLLEADEPVEDELDALVAGEAIWSAFDLASRKLASRLTALLPEPPSSADSEDKVTASLTMPLNWVAEVVDAEADNEDVLDEALAELTRPLYESFELLPTLLIELTMPPVIGHADLYNKGISSKNRIPGRVNSGKSRIVAIPAACHGRIRPPRHRSMSAQGRKADTHASRRFCNT